MGVSSKDFENMLSRVQGKAAKDAPSKENLSFVAPEPGQTILGVDPSLRGTGYGVIKVANPVSEVLTMGVIKCPQSWKRSKNSNTLPHSKSKRLGSSFLSLWPMPLLRGPG